MSTRVRIFALFLPAYFLSYFFRSANAVIADDLVADLGLSAAELGFTTSAFFIAFAGAQLPLGAALDRFGARRTTSLLMLFGVVGSLLFGLASSLWVLALGRALLGLGMAGTLMGALKVFSERFSPRRFATVSGLFVGTGTLGALSASTPLAWLNGLIGWRVVFLALAGVTLLSALALMFGVPPAKALPEAKPGESGRFIDIFRNLNFWRIALLAFSMVGAMFAYQGLWLGPFLRDGFGLSRLQVGNLLLLMNACLMAGYLVSGWLADRFGLAQVAILAAFLSLLMQAILVFFQDTWLPGMVALILAAFGFCSAFGILFFAHVRRVFPPTMTGRAVAAVNVFGIGGGALLQWLLGVVVGSFPEAAAGDYPAAAYRVIFVITGGLNLAALLFYLPMLQRARDRAYGSAQVT